ncbi:MAG: hypothetical protein ACI85K_001443 [Hyphomicrobiaceae bacterium]|jgi:hypothetical protein
MSDRGKTSTLANAEVATQMQRAQTLSGWRLWLHRGVLWMILAGCAFGLLASGLTGIVVTHKVTGSVLSQSLAGNAIATAWMLATIVFAGIALASRSRRASLWTGIATVVASLLAAATIFCDVMELLCTTGLMWWRIWENQFEVYTELWPQTAVRAAIVICVIAGPLSLVVHTIAWLIEDRVHRLPASGHGTTAASPNGLEPQSA